MSLRVLQAGTFSLLVDRGRPATRSLGVPVGGAADRAALAVGNALVGNDPGAVALEITLSGPTLRAEADVSLCVFGAPFRCSIVGVEFSAGQVMRLRGGESLQIAGTAAGARAYLCVHGGFVVKKVLGSGSAFAPIAPGGVLECAESHGSGRSLPAAEVRSLLEDFSPPHELRVVDGPQADWFQVGALAAAAYTVLPASDRMGVRLNGLPLDRAPREMVSEAVAPGAVQITNDGQPIILGADGQTIGGYPKLAHVIAADLDCVGQLRPGQSVRFRRVTLDEARALAEERRRKLWRWLTALRLAAT
jgi:biotin-dependent carboxylase-like uncharacterized protein